ncbi:unnamed protein product, partial [Brenthis ino]
MAKEYEEFPYEIQDVEPELAEELMKHSTEKTGFVRVGPKGYFFPTKFKEFAPSLYNMEVREDDIFVVTFPRSGTTWTQELVWLLQNNLDFEKAINTSLPTRFPFVEHTMLIHPEFEKRMYEKYKDDKEKLEIAVAIHQSGIKKVADMPSPRFIKSHLPLSLLPPYLLDKTKVVYVTRDPRDVVVSLHHFYRSNTIVGAPDDFKEFWKYFIKGQVYFAPILEHVKEAWNMRHHPNMLFIFYEELLQDLPAMIQKIASFLGKHYTEAQVEQLCDYVSFDKFKRNQAVNLSMISKVEIFNDPNSFMRKGVAGDWINYFDQQMKEETTKWLEDNLKDTDLVYPSYT